MNIQFETPQRLKIQLTADDLKKLGVSYNDIDYASPDTRKMLDDLLGRIGAKEDFCITDRRLVIEILPAEKEGCTIYLTLITPAPPKKRRFECTPCVWQLETADDLMAALKELAGCCKNKISLYLLDGKYRLIIQAEKRGAADLILTEYGRRLGGKAARLHTLEHGRLLSDDLMAQLSPRKPI